MTKRRKKPLDAKKLVAENTAAFDRVCVAVIMALVMQFVGWLLTALLLT